MPEPCADTLATVVAGRTAFVARLRAVAARLEELPLDSAAEVLVLLEPAVAVCEQRAAVALERAPTEHPGTRRRVTGASMADFKPHSVQDGAAPPQRRT